MKTLDLSIFPNVASTEIVKEVSGDKAVIHLTNGAKIILALDNDGIFYEKPDETREATVGLLVDTGAGFATPAEEPTVWRPME